MKIGIVDYNMGNLASVNNAFKKIGTEAEIVNDADKLKNYDKLVFPGVGAFGDAMEHLRETNLDEAMKEFVKSGKYVIGVCLGMQLLFESSEEFGKHKGLGIIEGNVVKFDKNKMQGHKIPHMGWNKMFVKNDALFEGVNDPYLYFVHSYHVVCDKKYIIGKTIYEYEFVSAVNKDNVYGFQPHPEKSHNAGLKILENFVKL
ncbi:imidazole glycerol phosphate synthase, glutamine amidotransferase subunit [Nautilia profundicola AmH]|uniref:Imidazole glycerol phosphate synthase subunit HisH n=1 Tax=Nautilia profundicola (strain ATCC BAA-1463 / DSM 18972 / AmH) TaxID=598659 RepID=B9L7G1_NAUPA|nr:imidazole glycerol phosphate synthase subunit HisH [Nautilia profundicola]ACM93372.1 imidazole glycerol phosphate synthase, glutamine amidotransferase subunit [Nautilia profundicola AmH]